MDEHDQRRRPRRELRVTGGLRLLQDIEPWEFELVQTALAKPETTSPVAPETHDGE